MGLISFVKNHGRPFFSMFMRDVPLFNKVVALKPSLIWRRFLNKSDVNFCRLNKSDVKIGEDERFLIVTFIFQTILNLVVVHLRYCGDEHHT